MEQLLQNWQLPDLYFICKQQTWVQSSRLQSRSEAKGLTFWKHEAEAETDDGFPAIINTPFTPNVQANMIWKWKKKFKFCITTKPNVKFWICEVMKLKLKLLLIHEAEAEGLSFWNHEAEAEALAWVKCFGFAKLKTKQLHYTHVWQAETITFLMHFSRINTVCK